MDVFPTERIRNVVLLSHGGAGKTSLAEAALFNAGVISRMGRVEDGTTTSDYEPEAAKRGSSVQCTVLPCPWKGTKINILDTPGYLDFYGETMAGLRAADAAVLVICAASGIEVGTELLWKHLQDNPMPLLIFFNKLNRDNADFQGNLAAVQSRLTRKAAPLQMPLGSAASFKGVVDLLDHRGDISSEHKATAGALREKLVELIAESDEELTNKYLEGEELGAELLSSALRKGVLNREIIPVLVGSATQNVGVTQLLDAVVSLLPSPKEARPLEASRGSSGGKVTLVPGGPSPLVAQVFKTTADPYVGRLSYIRVFSGILSSDSQVWNAKKSAAERIGQLYAPRGKSQEPVPRLEAGDIGSVAKLSDTATCDTLGQKDQPLLLPPITFPVPSYSVAVHPKSKADLDKLSTGMVRLCDEDPSLRMSKEQDTGELILSGLGDAHIDVAVERMRRKFGVEVRLELPRVPYRETITVPAKAEYKHKKQTGGHGQYGHVLLELEPQPGGSAYEFGTRVFGGAVPRNFFPAVEKGVIEGLQEGVVAGYPVVGVKVVLYDGSYHAVDSSEMSFKIAASHATRKGLAEGQPVLLEPVVKVTITVPDNSTGDVIGGLNSKRARVLGMAPHGGLTTIEAEAPLAEMQRYSAELRAITQGRGLFSMEFDHYDAVPSHLAQKIAEEAKKARG